MIKIDGDLAIDNFYANMTDSEQRYGREYTRLRRLTSDLDRKIVKESYVSSLFLEETLCTNISSARS